MILRPALCIAYAGVIFGVSSIPGDQLHGIRLVSDYLMHIVEYLILGMLIMWYRLHHAGIFRGKALSQSVLFGSLYGFADEIHQYFVPYRCADPVDWVADTLGVALGALVVLALYSVYSTRSIHKEGEEGGVR